MAKIIAVGIISDSSDTGGLYIGQDTWRASPRSATPRNRKNAHARFFRQRNGHMVFAPIAAAWQPRPLTLADRHGAAASPARHGEAIRLPHVAMFDNVQLLRCWASRAFWSSLAAFCFLLAFAPARSLSFCPARWRLHILSRMRKKLLSHSQSGRARGPLLFRPLYLAVAGGAREPNPRQSRCLPFDRTADG